MEKITFYNGDFKLKINKEVLDCLENNRGYSMTDFLENMGYRLENSEYYSIKRVSIINDKTQKSYNWRKLKDMSFKMQKEIKSVPDNNYGLINSYHISVWKICYPDERY